MDNQGDQASLINHCPDCGQSLVVDGFSPFSKIACPNCDSAVRVRTTLGQYEISQMLGEGGMSQVFRATDQTLAREVALKILHQKLSKDSSLTAMFEREAKLTASIHHPNVVKVYTVGRHQGYFYIAMELVDALSLEHHIASRGALPEEEVLNIAHDVTSGLQAAHHENLIHRDIKPGNMLVTSDGTTKLVDFGLAMQQGGVDESEDIWATPFYVPPEKLEGEEDTFKGDIYSLGATLFHALAGHPPFAANTSSLDELKLIKAAAISLKDSSENVSKDTVKLVEKMMAYDPGDRFASYDEMLSAIEDVQEKVFGTKRGRSGGVEGLFSSIWVKAGLGVVILLSAIVLAVYFNVRERDDGDPILGIGGGSERVISAAAKAQAQRFLKGRKYMIEGDFQAAGEIFDKLAKVKELSSSTQSWNQFNRGLNELFKGNEKEARKLFSELAGMENFSKDIPELAGQEIFLKKVAGKISQPLPLLPEIKNIFPADSIQSLGLLAGGLKNWNMGQMESAVEWFDLFSASKVPVNYEWISELKPLLEAYRSDLALIKGDAPNPSRKSDADSLAKQKSLLEDLLTQLKTRGAAPALLKSRIARIDFMLAGDKEATAKREAEDKARQAAMAAAAQKAASTGGGETKETNRSPAETAEIERLIELRKSFASYSDSLLFSGVIPKLDAETFETELGKTLQQDLRFVYQQADFFLETLAGELSKGNYEGIIRRREGEDLDAKVTNASRDVYIIDLGFGPNEVGVETLSLSWLVEAAEEVLPPLSKESADVWRQVVCFAGASGLMDQGRRIARELAPELPEFAARLKRLEALRSKP